MALNNEVEAELDRLGATIQTSSRKSAREILVHDVQWPEGHFDACVEGFRRRNPGYQNSTVEEIEEDLPAISDLEFLKRGSEGFWEGWEAEFPQVDAERLSPFASDDACFYFLVDHFRVPSDPLVYQVGHEETDSEPTACDGLTVSEFLRCLERKDGRG